MNVCIGDGLTTDANGKLIVDERPLARGTLRRSTTQTVPAGASNVTTYSQLVYNTALDVVAMGTGGSVLTVQQAGLYLVQMAQGDNGPDNPGTDNATPVTIGIEIYVNGTILTSSRGPRNSSQTHQLHCSRVLSLDIGDQIAGWWNIHRLNAATTSHDLSPDPRNFLQATQLSTQYVYPTP